MVWASNRAGPHPPRRVPRSGVFPSSERPVSGPPCPRTRSAPSWPAASHAPTVRAQVPVARAPVAAVPALPAPAAVPSRSGRGAAASSSCPPSPGFGAMSGLTRCRRGVSPPLPGARSRSAQRQTAAAAAQRVRTSASDARSAGDPNPREPTGQDAGDVETGAWTGGSGSNGSRTPASTLMPAGLVRTGSAAAGPEAAMCPGAGPPARGARDGWVPGPVPLVLARSA